MGTVCEVKGGASGTSGGNAPAVRPAVIPVTRPLVKKGNYAFPVASPFYFKDTWNAARAGHVHKGVDIFAVESTPVYAVTDGVIVLLAHWRGAGLTIRLKGADGRGYEFMHLHDFEGGLKAAFGLSADFHDRPDRKTRKWGRYDVRAGKPIGFVGSTGIRRSAPHLHFQVFPDHRFVLDERINFYTFLVELCTGSDAAAVKSVTSYVL